MKTIEIFLAQFRDLFRLRLKDRNNLSNHLTSFETHLTRFQHRCAVEKETDEMNLPYLMKDLVTADSFKIATLLSTLSSDLDDQVDIITLRNLTYEQVTTKLSGVAARDKLKEEENGEDKAYSSTSFNKGKKKTSNNIKPKNEGNSKAECTYCKRHFPKSKWTGHTWSQCRKLKAAKKKKDQEGGESADGSRSERAAMADEQVQGARPAVSSSTFYPAKSIWLFDTGASSHMTSNADLILNLKPTQVLVRIADDKNLVCEGFGKVEFMAVLPGEPPRKVVLERVLYVPSLGRVSLLSWNAIERKGDYELRGKRGQLFVYNEQNEKVIWAKKTNGSYLVQIKNVEHASVAYEQWHEAFCHVSPKNMRTEMYEDERDLPTPPKDFHCTSCALSKSTKQVPKTTEHRVPKPLDRMYSDLSGKQAVKTKGGAQYYVTLIDEKTRYVWIRLLKLKSDTSKALESMIREAERQTERKLKVLRTDNAGEYIAIDVFLDHEGAVHERSPAYSHESNGLPERLNRTLGTMVRGMLASSNLPLSMWGEAVHTAVYVKNRLPHRAVKTTPYEELHGEKPSIKHLKPFGQKCYVHVLPEQRKAGSKLLPRAKEDRLVGYTSGTDKIYRIYIPSENRIVESRQVKFAPFEENHTEEQQELREEKPTKEEKEQLESVVLPLRSWRRVQRTNQQLQQRQRSQESQTDEESAQEESDPDDNEDVFVETEEPHEQRSEIVLPPPPADPKDY